MFALNCTFAQESSLSIFHQSTTTHSQGYVFPVADSFIQTTSQYWNYNFGEHRLAFLLDIFNELFSDQKNNKNQKDKHLILMSGPPATGKSTILKMMLEAELFGYTQLLLISSDILKWKLLEKDKAAIKAHPDWYENYPDYVIEGLQSDEGEPQAITKILSFYHAEASFLADLAIEYATIEGLSFIIDGTLGKSIEGAEFFENLSKRYKAMHENSQVTVIDVSSTEIEAIENMQQRRQAGLHAISDEEIKRYFLAHAIVLEHVTNFVDRIISVSNRHRSASIFRIDYKPHTLHLSGVMESIVGLNIKPDQVDNGLINVLTIEEKPFENQHLRACQILFAN